MVLREFINRHTLYSKRSFFGSIAASIALFCTIVFVTKENAFVTYEGTKAFAFCYVIAAFYIGFSNSVSNFSEERVYIVQQLRNRLYSMSTYIIGSLIRQTVLCFGQAICATIVFTYFDYGTEGLVLSNSNMDILMSLFLTIEAGMCLGFAVGELTVNVRSAMCIMPLILVSQMLFCGGIFTLDGICEKIADFMITKHSLATLGGIIDINGYPLAIKSVYPVVTQEVNPLFESTREAIVTGWIHMIVLSVASVAFSYCSLYYILHKKD